MRSRLSWWPYNRVSWELPIVRRYSQEEFTYRVKGIVPKGAQQFVLAEEAWGRGIGGTGKNAGENSTDDVKTEADTSTILSTSALGNDNAKDLSTKVAEVVQRPGQSTNLSLDVLVTVNDGSSNALSPHNEDEGHVVSPTIDAGQEIITKLGAVRQGEEEGHNDASGDDNGAVPLGLGIHDEGDDGVEHRKGGGVAECHKGEEEHDGPEVGGGHGDNSFGEGEEADSEAADAVFRIGIHAEETHDAKDSEGGNVLEHDVAGDDEERVDDGVGVFLVVTGVRGEIAEANAGGKEYLTAGRLPNGPLSQLATSPGGPHKLNAPSSVLKRTGTADEDNGDDDGQAHGEVDDTAGQTGALEDGNEDEEPGEDGPADRFGEKLHAVVLEPKVSLAGLGVEGDDLVVVFGGLTGPRQGALEGAAEVDHDPGEVGNEVRPHDEADV